MRGDEPEIKNLPGYGYCEPGELTREDRYTHPYQGRVYADRPMTYLGQHGALEVMTMAFQHVFADKVSVRQDALDRDREMINLVVGLLYRYVP